MGEELAVKEKKNSDPSIRSGPNSFTKNSEQPELAETPVDLKAEIEPSFKATQAETDAKDTTTTPDDSQKVENKSKKDSDG